MAQGGRQTVSLICTVDAVDKEARTVDCTPLDEGAPLLGVNLQANQESKFGVVVYPRVGSYVVVGFVADGSAGVVLLTDDIESIEVVVKDDNTSLKITEDGIVLNGGELGGLVKVEELTSKLNELIDAFNNHTHTLKIGTVNVAGSATAQSNEKPITVPAITSKHTKVSRGDYENEKVKQ